MGNSNGMLALRIFVLPSFLGVFAATTCLRGRSKPRLQVSLGTNHVFDYEVHLLEDLGCLVESVI